MDRTGQGRLDSSSGYPVRQESGLTAQSGGRPGRWKPGNRSKYPRPNRAEDSGGLPECMKPGRAKGIGPGHWKPGRTENSDGRPRRWKPGGAENSDGRPRRWKPGGAEDSGGRPRRWKLGRAGIG
ncbi:hypothetical protein LDENG_00051280 [Lucifuga dentata]|nr:hypothetical protein LDENG_00051280 [Lucifuga dentata]